MRRTDNEPRIYGPYKHGDVYRLHYVTIIGGKRKTEYTTHQTRAAADLELAGARDEAQGVTVRMAVDQFLAWKTSKGAVSNTIDNYEYRLSALLGLEINASRPIRWIAARGAELYAASIPARRSDTHINGLSVGRMFGKFCVKQKLLKRNPFSDVESVGKRMPGAYKSRLTINESRQLEAFCFKYSHNPDCVLTYAYLMLGKRASEIVAATVRDLDDDGWRLRIVKAKTLASIKSIPLMPQLRDMLLDLAKDRAPDAHLFMNQSGAPMSRFVARDRVRAILLAARVPVLPPQALRRTFVDVAALQGRALKSIAEMAGQTSEAVTQRSYAAPDQIEAQAVERNFQIIAGGKR